MLWEFVHGKIYKFGKTGRCKEISIRVSAGVGARCGRKILAVVERWPLVEVRRHYVVFLEKNKLSFSELPFAFASKRGLVQNLSN